LQQIAGWTETLAHNNGTGTCTSAAFVSSGIATWAGFTPRIGIVPFQIPNAGLLFHAATEIQINGRSSMINAGAVMSPSAFLGAMTEFAKGHNGTRDAMDLKPPSEIHQLMNRNDTWFYAPATAPKGTGVIGGALANPYMWDPNVAAVRNAMGF
jgi:hypothetical protein